MATKAQERILAATAAETFQELLAAASAAGKTLLPLPLPMTGNPLASAGITARTVLQPEQTRQVWADDGKDDNDATTGWDDHTGGGFGASLAQASSRSAAMRTIVEKPAIYGMHVPEEIFVLGASSLAGTLWVLQTFTPNEIRAMFSLMGPDFERQLMGRYRVECAHLLVPFSQR